MKKALYLSLALILVLSFSACGSENVYPSEPEITTESTQEPPETMQKAVEATQGAAFEITYAKADTYENSIGSTWCQTIVEITNTGSDNLYLSAGAYDLEDSSGNLIAAQSSVSCFPNVLAPGEKGYMYEETTLDAEFAGELTVIPHFDVKTATVDLIRFDTSDLSLKNTKYFGVGAQGRLMNNTETAIEDEMIYVVVVLYDENNLPVGLEFDILDSSIQPGEKIGFETSALSMPDSVNVESVASTIVYAYPFQFQF